MSRDSKNEILKRCGSQKRWESIEDLIKSCKDTCKALGPMCEMAGGFFGWKFSELIPMLEDENEKLFSEE